LKYKAGEKADRVGKSNGEERRYTTGKASRKDGGAKARKKSWQRSESVLRYDTHRLGQIYAREKSLSCLMFDVRRVSKREVSHS
jgi:hypothetical protein